MKQAGIAKADAILAVMIVVLVVVGGAVYFKKQQGAGSGAASTSSAPASTPAHKPAEAQPVVRKAFDAALGYAGTQAHTPQGSVDIVKPYLSATLYDKLSKQVSSGSDQDVVLCAQMRPASVQAVLNDTSGDIATVLVDEGWSSSHTTITTTVDLKTLKIVSLTCPPAGQ